MKCTSGIVASFILLVFIFSAGLYRQEKNAGQTVHAIISPAMATVQTPGSWQVSLVLEADSMAIGGGVKVRFVKGFDPMPQSRRPASGGYVKASASNSHSKLEITRITREDTLMTWSWDRNSAVVTALVENRALHKGDTISLVFGANAPYGQFIPPQSAFVDSVLVAYDLDGSGIYYQLTPSPVLEILPRSPYRLAGYLPSTIIPGEPAKLKIVVLDDYENVATSFAGTITLAATDPSAVYPRTVQLETNDHGRKTVDVIFRSPGVHHVQLGVPAKGLDSLWQVRSNPVQVLSGAPLYRVFWGDLHTHSSFSRDGHGTGGFLKARDVACLDFYALTDHASNPRRSDGGITSEEWEKIKQDVIQYHEPGKFVTFPAYEFSAWVPSGHHNIFFNAPDELVSQVPLFREEQYHQVKEVWKLKDLLPPGMDMITVPHHTGIIWDKNLGNGPWVSFGEGYANPKLRPLIEIYSHHGLSEYYAPQHPLSYKALHKAGVQDLATGPHYAQDAWAAGEILGVIASSDDHSARPGLPFKGLAAVYARELTRDAIFDALKNRRTYGTTGQRILLQFEINGYLMGSQITVERGKYPEIRVVVHGTDDLDFVEVLRWSHTSGRREAGHPVFEIVQRKAGQGNLLFDKFIDSTYVGAAIYYVRAKQKRDTFDSWRSVYRQVWAWSSPIWVKDESTSDTTDTKPIPHQFQLKQNFPNPFVHTTSIAYYLSRDGKVIATLYNVLGQRMRPLLHDFQTAGWHSLKMSSQGLTQGIYFLRFEIADQVLTQKIVVTK